MSKTRNSRLILAGLALYVAGAGSTTLSALQEEEDLRVIASWPLYSDASHNLFHLFRQEAVVHLERRKQRIAEIDTSAGWRARQAEIRSTLAEIVGEFPERTPLNARVTGIIQREGVRVEKLIYESVPGLFVTAALFIPDPLEHTPAPAILFCSGHAAEGFRSPAYQTMILNLVDKGFIVLAFDPVGQGERLEYLPKTDSEPALGPTRQHSYPGAQGFLLGGSPARHMIWDGIRGVDYLESRTEVDSRRLGVAGRSGGGTQSAYIAAMDDRIVAAAPEAYITNFYRLLSSLGAQDVEQNLYRGIARGLDHGDLLVARAPKPTLLIATTRDFFSIQGTRETLSETRAAFTYLGDGEAIGIAEDDGPHGSTRRNREAMYQFFQRSLGQPGNPEETDFALLDEDALRVTDTGQLQTSIEGETVYSLNRTRARDLATKLDTRRANLVLHLPKTLAAARELSGYRQPTRSEVPIFAGRHPRTGYSVEKYLLEGEGRDVIPYLLMVPDGQGPHPGLLYFHPRGKAEHASPGGPMERLVRAGYLVAAPDLAGLGELAPGHYGGDALFGEVSFNLWFSGIMVGRSLVGERARDIVRLATVLRRYHDIEDGPVVGLGYEQLGAALLHAAAFDPSIGRIVLIDPLVSYLSIALTRDYQPRFIPASVANSLSAYDLPDLAATLAPRPLLTAGMIDASGRALSLDEITREWKLVHRAYRDAGTVAYLSAPKTIDEILNWLRDHS